MDTDPSPLTITIANLPTMRAYDRLAEFGAGMGRVLTVAGGAIAGSGLLAPGAAGLAAAGTVGATAAGLGILWLSSPPDLPGPERATAGVMYATPGIGLTAILTAECLAAHFGWTGFTALAVQAVSVLVWTAATWLSRLPRRARRMLSPQRPQTLTDAAEMTADIFNTGGPHVDPAAAEWARKAAIPGGLAPNTALENIEETGPGSMRAIICSTIPGEPVPDISIKRLSALADIDEDLITIGPVPGRGAGVRLLTIGRPAAAADPAAIWARDIAPKAMPGTTLIDIRVGPATTPATAPATGPSKEIPA